MNSLTPEQALKKVWGFSAFRPLQRETVESVLAGRDAMVVLPTGGGKSLCYQLPAACGIGLVLVISPLIALMDDQVAAAREHGLVAGALHSHSKEDTRRRIFADMHRGTLDLLYVSPERLVVSGLLDLIKPRLGLFAVDEAHCVSHWGHEFRPEYRQLRPLFDQFPTIPRMALTATATPAVQDDIREQLGMRDPLNLIGHPDRPNLIYRTFPRYDQGRQVLDIIRQHPGEGGIVYAQTRREVDRLAAAIAKAGVSCAPYHAGLTPQQRARAQEDFVFERLQVVIATIAFGMGIDRSNVRYVIHANTPKSIEHYQQESGRAGRDGEPAECVLFFSVADLITHRALSFREAGVSAERRRVIERQLSQIGRYAIAPVCRHRLLSEHFGQPYPIPGMPAASEAANDIDGPAKTAPSAPITNAPPTVAGGCDACDVCLGETQALADEEALLTAQKIISAVFRTESRFGAGYVAKVLLGRDDERIAGNGHASLRVYGLMKDCTEPTLRSWIDQLVVQGHLAVSEGEYPVLQMTKSGFDICKGIGTVRLGNPVPKALKKTRRTKDASGKTKAPSQLTGPAAPLFENLRRLRLLLARKQGIPPYMVFPDSVLSMMSVLTTANLDILRQIKGIGDQKRDRYGQAFLDVLSGRAPDDVAEAFIAT